MAKIGATPHESRKSPTTDQTAAVPRMADVL
jgi:hypothetical protein